MKLTLNKIYIGIFVLFIGLTAGYQYGTKDEVIFTVTGKERVTTGSGDSISHKYLVFTDGETLQNTDAFFHLKFSSSDIYGRLKEGQQIKASVYGWRLPFFSVYRNIVSVQVLSK